MTARESASLRRELRFVLSRRDYDAAVWTIEHDPDAGAVLRRLDQLGRGRLTIVVTDYGIRPNASANAEWDRELFEWITVAGRACVPKETDRRLKG